MKRFFLRSKATLYGSRPAKNSNKLCNMHEVNFFPVLKFPIQFLKKIFHHRNAQLTCSNLHQSLKKEYLLSVKQPGSLRKFFNVFSPQRSRSVQESHIGLASHWLATPQLEHKRYNNWVAYKKIDKTFLS